MTILLTRPKDDALVLGRELRRMGYASILSPMLEVTFVNGPKIRMDKYDAILSTSANGVRALARRTENRIIPIFAVGHSTAAAASNLKFRKVLSADGDVTSLAKKVLSFYPSPSKFIHVAGTALAGDLSGELKKFGHCVDRAIVYKTHVCSSLTDEAVSSLERQVIKGVIIYSPKTAEAFCSAISKCPGLDYLRNVHLIALSDAVHRSAVAPWSSVCVARKPNKKAVFEALERAIPLKN